jgi:hypothetical protein
MKIVAVGVLALVSLMVFPRLTVTICAFIVHPLLGVVVGLFSLMTLE